MPVSTPTRVAAGSAHTPPLSARPAATQASAQRNGAALETDLAVFHGGLTDWLVCQQYPRTLNQRVVGKGPPDFLAVHRTQGGVLFDAKSITKRHWPISLLDAHQAAMLGHAERTGNRGAIYLRTSSGDYWIPWPALAPLWDRWWRGREAVTLDGSEGVPVRGMDWTRVIAW